MIHAPWLPQVAPKPCQGDVYTEVPFGVSVHPPAFLLQKPYQDGRKKLLWEQKEGFMPHPDPNNAQGNFVACGRLNKFVLVSQNCEIDKAFRPDLKGLILVAPIRSLALANQQQRELILKGTQFCYFPLVGMPGLDDHMVDLTQISAMRSRQIVEQTCLCSMTVEGKFIFQNALNVFLTRPEEEDEEIRAELLAKQLAAAETITT